MAETKEDQGINIEQTLGKTEEFVNKNILDPSSAKDMMALFSKAELKQ